MVKHAKAVIKKKSSPARHHYEKDEEDFVLSSYLKSTGHMTLSNSCLKCLVVYKCEKGFLEHCCNISICWVYSATSFLLR